MTCDHLHVLPLSLFILIPVTFMITYTISVQWDHVVPGFLYISETGTLSPESCIFAQCLNIAALLLGCCVYIRHRQVEQWQIERGHELVDRRIIIVTVWCGILACFGLDILANFQEARVVAAHMIGAITCFTAGTMYFSLQTYFSYKMAPAVNGMSIVYVRAILSTLTLVLTVTTIIPGYVSMSEFRAPRRRFRQQSRQGRSSVDNKPLLLFSIKDLDYFYSPRPKSRIPTLRTATASGRKPYVDRGVQGTT
ncbi:DNA damage-regulated autophagy modulator protein 2 isoform X2 [Orussus abietinus]|uniref:DNA damage-regulated autophagy modulator protein 2 isoform X2 n=1 Tax=Orussus abietinus TaxID=222816 RepID=UPI0006255AE5|nr:DNA damage-regulated autophagy modulator protein 2 isoform X2 [Orussus abietinus]